MNVWGINCIEKVENELCHQMKMIQQLFVSWILVQDITENTSNNKDYSFSLAFIYIKILTERNDQLLPKKIMKKF